MGQQSSKGMFPQSRYYTVLDYGYCKVWKRKDSQRQTMQQYEVTIQNQQELLKYQKMWQLRMQEEDVVGVYYFSNHVTQEICSVVQNASILTERIPYRLSQFCNIPYREILNILKICFKAFKILYNEYGLFRVRSTMLGINCQRQLKVWHHTDFSTPEPENSNCRSLLEMIQSIIQAVEVNADQPFEFVRFSQFVNVNRDRINMNFDEMSTVLETYRKMNKIAVCQGLPQISHYLRQAEGWEEISFNSNFVANLSNLAQIPSLNFQRDFVSHNKMPSELNYSNKTVKRSPSPSMNIYTHREVNRILQNQNHSNYFKSRQQRMQVPENIYQMGYTPPKLIPQQYNPQYAYQQSRPVLRYENSLQKRQSAVIAENRLLHPVVAGRSGVQQETKREKAGTCSIDRKLYEAQRNRYKGDIYRFAGGQLNGGRPHFGNERRGRFEISSVRSNSLSNSKSKESFVYI